MATKSTSVKPMVGNKTKTTKQKTKKTIPSTEFSLIAPEANEVYLVGDFNQWNGDGFRMRKFKDGSCKKTVKLSPGRHEYRFVVDGQWCTDPINKERCANPFGSENSVIVI
ncbi:MAG: isoamylase early set domain-containing protein [Desulfobulbaceae bacterium]|nr:isoamylase early set domain-containing protein [Desulfobulbaceae bacterium]HIJ79862.1 glycoside hydrolase family 13 [Deltaproteobacteria bacterium]